MTKHVLIVGGGFTGLTVAHRLAADSRFSITVLESSSQLGGLAGGFPLLGNSLEKTYHHLFLTDTSILELVEELGLSDKLIWCDSSMGIYWGGRTYPFRTPLDLLRFSPCSFAGRVRLGLVALYLKHKKNWRALAGQKAHEWMTRACGQSAMNSVWTPLLKGKFDRYYDSVSMAWLWARIHIRANSRAPRGGGEKLGYFRGGFNAVIAALEKKLRQQGVTIKTNTVVEKIFDNRCALVNGREVPFDYCLFTGPSPAFARLLPEFASLANYRQQLQSIDYLGAICLVFTSEQNLGDYYWLNINEPEAPFLVFINHTRLVDKNQYQGKFVYYLGAYKAQKSESFSLTDDALTELWWQYLRKIFPEFNSGLVGERHVFRFNTAQHIVDTEYEKKMPAHRTPLPGVFLANFSQIFPEDRGTNFAVREGNKIAEMLKQQANSAGYGDSESRR
jgi:protoporphyrinogen oxidase